MIVSDNGCLPPPGWHARYGSRPGTANGVRCWDYDNCRPMPGCPEKPATIGADMDPLDRKLDEMQKDDAAMVRSLVRLKERVDRLEHDSVANDADLLRNLVRLKERVDRAEHTDVTHDADLEKALALTDQLTATLERMR